MIRTGGSDYRAILLPANRLIPLSTMQRLLALAKAGARILFYRQLPEALARRCFDAGGATVRRPSAATAICRRYKAPRSQGLVRARLVAADDPALLYTGSRHSG